MTRSTYKPRFTKPASPVMLEMFACPKYATKLTRHACGSMYRRAHGSTRVGHEAACTAEVARCRHCEVGAVHVKGTPHPDMHAVAAPVIAASTLTRKVRRALCACGCGEPVAKGRRAYASMACSARVGTLQRVTGQMMVKG